MVLNDRVSLAREEVLKVPGGGTEKKFKHKRFIYCDITFQRMKNKYKFNQEINSNIITIIARASKDIFETDRIVYKNIEYEIKSIIPLKKYKNHIELVCEEYGKTSN